MTKPSRSRVEGAGGAGGLVIAGGEGLHGGETAYAEGDDRGLGAAGEEGVGFIGADHAPGLADGVAGGGAGGDGGEIWALEAEFHGDEAAGHVGDHHRDHEGRDAAGAFVHEDGVLIGEGFESANAAADDAAEAGEVRADGGIELAIGEGVAGGGHGELGVTVGAADVLGAFEVADGLEALDLAGDAAVVFRGIKGGDGADAADAGGEVGPEGLEVHAHRGDDSKAGDDDSAFVRHGMCLEPQREYGADANGIWVRQGENSACGM